MSSPFFEISKIISDDFIQSVTFFDDEASYSGATNDHHLNAQEVIQFFASKNKLCSVYKVNNLEDIHNVVALSQKSDVTILDWRININPIIVNTEDEESDDDEDIRGKFTTDVIRKLFQLNNNKLKLIIIYTGENEFDGIIEDIKVCLKEINIETEQEGFNLTYKNYRISLYGKATLKGKRLRKEIRERLIEYSELPDMIVEEFTKISFGLLNNLALKTLSVLRENTFELINTFDKKLDPAFLTHKALLPAPSDASDQMLEVIGSEIKSLLVSYSATEAISNDSIKHYIESTISTKGVSFTFSERKQFKEIKIPKVLTQELLINYAHNGIEKVLISKNTPISESRLFGDIIHKLLTKYYLHGNTNEDESNKELAILTSIKSIYNNNFMPLLTLGSIINYKSEYWICITPKCDLTRIDKNRDVLFASLKIVEDTKRFDFILKTANGFLNFKVNDSIHKSRFFKLKQNNNGSIRAVVDKDKRWFKGESVLEYVGELKSDFAQSISNNFSSQLARVGMDHSEWLRRS